MIYSRTMRNADYTEMEIEGAVIIDIQKKIQMWNGNQHPARLWEYALAQKVLTAHFGNRKNLLVADHGCGGGYLSPIMYWLGHRVRMYDCWMFGNEENFMMEQMNRVTLHRTEVTGDYQMFNRPLSQLIEEDRGVDAAFCISTLEHIIGYQFAYRDLLSTVRPGGLVFVTTDFADHEQDDFPHSRLRAGKMFTERTYREMEQIAHSMGFWLLGRASDWMWSEECKLVHGYGFASLAMIKAA